jgi:uncharacterized protein involved in response to NO
LQDHAPQSSFTVFALGFRPFFLVAAAAAVILPALWLFTQAGTLSPATYYGIVGWHGHEMIFGYTSAVIAGFFLTAVPNWTGMPTLGGKSLAALTALWIGGRLLPFFPASLPHWSIALVEVAFLPALAASLVKPLLRGSGRKINLIFPPILVLMALADILIHLQILGITDTTAYEGIQLALYLVVLVIVIIGGRVIPFFAGRVLPDASTSKWQAVERLSVGSLIALTAAEVLFPAPMLVGVLGALAAAAHSVRLAGWHTRKVWSFPLLWVLYVGYAWLVVGFGLVALAAAGLLLPYLALHALSVGAVGVLTLGMMARVALGHTGRPLQAAGPIVLAFVLVNLAAVTRVLLPIAFPGWYSALVQISGAIWIAAFLIFMAVYTPILIRPRVDGRAG